MRDILGCWKELWKTARRDSKKRRARRNEWTKNIFRKFRKERIARFTDNEIKIPAAIGRSNAGYAEGEGTSFSAVFGIYSVQDHLLNSNRNFMNLAKFLRSLQDFAKSF